MCSCESLRMNIHSSITHDSQHPLVTNVYPKKRCNPTVRFYRVTERNEDATRRKAILWDSMITKCSE